MAAALENAIDARWPAAARARVHGVVVARYGHVVPARTIRVLEASHPVPDAASLTGARALLAAVTGLKEDDLVICLASGGGSAVVSLPVAGDTIEGEAREVAKKHAAIALSCKQHGDPLAALCVILSGGETTVTVRGNRKGGRNQKFALGLALALKGASGIHALSADTDGIDGVCDAAGAFVAPDTLRRAEEAG